MKSNLVNLAKGNGKKTSPIPTKKPTTKPVPKVVEKPKSKEEVRDEKAKETVEKLLQDVELTPKIEIVEANEEIPTNEPKGDGSNAWLEEQLTILSEANELLKSELLEAKDNYSRLYQQFQNGSAVIGNPENLSDETYKQNILFMFDELQANFLGLNQERNRYSIVNIDYMLKQFLSLFPFTEQYRKF